MSDIMGGLGFGAIAFIAAFLVILMILWLILPFAVFDIKSTQKETAKTIESMEETINVLAVDIARMAEIQQKEHEMKMAVVEARKAKTSG